jgi:hypothetical protein
LYGTLRRSLCLKTFTLAAVPEEQRMKCLSKRAEAIFRQLIEGLTEPGQHRRIDNTAGTFMPVSIDVLSV